MDGYFEACKSVYHDHAWYLRRSEGITAPGNRMTDSFDHYDSAGNQTIGRADSALTYDPYLQYSFPSSLFLFLLPLLFLPPLPLFSSSSLPFPLSPTFFPFPPRPIYLKYILFYYFV